MINKKAAKWAQKIANRREKKVVAVLDLAATSSFWCEYNKHVQTIRPSNKTVHMSTGLTAEMSNKALLPNSKLNEQARNLDILPALKDNLLFSICKFSDKSTRTKKKIKE